MKKRTPEQWEAVRLGRVDCYSRPAVDWRARCAALTPEGEAPELLAAVRRRLEGITCLSGEGPDTIELHADMNKARRELWRAICDEGLAGLKEVDAVLAHLRAARGGGAPAGERAYQATLKVCGLLRAEGGVDLNTEGEVRRIIREAIDGALPPADDGGVEVATITGTVHTVGTVDRGIVNIAYTPPWPDGSTIKMVFMAGEWPGARVGDRVEVVVKLLGRAP
jgi:hypothetical protein